MWVSRVIAIRNAGEENLRRPRQTREMSARWAVRRSRKCPEFVSAKRVQTPLQGVCTTIERTVSNPATSTPRDIVNQCSRGFSFIVEKAHFSCLQPARLHGRGQAVINCLSAYFRIIPVFSSFDFYLFKLKRQKHQRHQSKLR